MKATIDSKSIKMVCAWYAEVENERETQKIIDRVKVKKLVEEGIDKQLARDMVKCGLV